MDMVEKVARAIKCFETRRDAELSADGPWREFELDKARAAIAAMREPTKDMVRAAAKAMSPTERPSPDWMTCRDKHATRYRAMIDAALSNTGDPK